MYTSLPFLLNIEMLTDHQQQLRSLRPVLQGFRDSRHWSVAHTVVEWLSKIEHLPNKSNEHHQKLKTLLDQELPSWRAWACWQPNVARIKKWGKLNLTLQGQLRCIIALDGPDFDSNGKTLGKSLPDHKLPKDRRTSSILTFNGETHEECLYMAEKLLRLADKSLTYRPEDREIFFHLMTGVDILRRKLDLIEILTSVGFETIRDRIAEAYLLRGASKQTQIDAVKWLLKKMNANPKYRTLRDVFAVDFGPLVKDMIQEERSHLLAFMFVAEALGTNVMTFEQQLDLRLDLVEASWLQPCAEYSHMLRVMDTWPLPYERTILRGIYLSLEMSPRASTSTSTLVPMISSRILGEPETPDDDSKSMLEALMSLWQTCKDSARRSIAICLVSEPKSITINLRILCLNQLPSLSDSFVQSYWHIVCDDLDNRQRSCVAFADLFASASLSVDMTHWTTLLRHEMVEEGEALLQYTLEHLTVQSWVLYLQNLHRLYGSDSNCTFSPGPPSPVIFTPQLLYWGRKLVPYTDILNLLKETPDSIDARRCLFLAAAEHLYIQARIQEILNALKPARRSKSDKTDTATRVSLLKRLSKDGSNAAEVRNALVGLNNLSPSGIEVCARIQHLSEIDLSPHVHQVFLEAWLPDPSLHAGDRGSLKTVFLHSADGNLSRDEKFVLAADYLDSEYVELLHEARRLAALRASLKTVDLQGVVELLADIGIEDGPHSEDVLASMPPEVLNAVEIVGEKEVEILFPLTHFTQIQRTALGLGSLQSFVLLLELCDHKTTPDRFCIHLGPESKDRTLGGLLDNIDGKVSPWSNTCRLGGLKTSSLCMQPNSFRNPFEYNLTKMLQRRLPGSNLGQDLTSLPELHEIITHHLKNIGRYCTECGRTFCTNLRKPTTCQLPRCIYLFANSDPQVKFPHLTEDQLVTDLLFSSLHAAASTSNKELLPNYPTDPPTLLSQLNNVPPLSNNPPLDTQTSSLLTYTLTSHRSYLLTATGSLKIPSLPPGTLQFLLANSTPEREALFSNPPQEKRILFHGTNPDRLWAILVQGLRILSGTDLQTNGAVSGKGVYLSDCPRVAFGYSTKILKIPDEGAWKRSALKGKGWKVLLGVEHRGESVAAGEGVIHVVREERDLVVRYVFLVPEGGERSVLVKGHLVPGMGSVCGGLRSGAL
ncbi:uncharacterized protein LY89DRAFT_137314 [Mollisia scopiformis]|uniref:PARP catalytic domain-containing protein n=1 Tax=Mollisia scopiformis TaxID=149040 RepID=A0A194X2G2_MOLSC|nr:uncharacterized protein LY89DRAFT_137314 [Mollisia scopiformis]KUJ14381.1 hypothetical protein LY89DRAFT_137314 [Mollisia scopiformis]